MKTAHKLPDRLHFITNFLIYTRGLRALKAFTSRLIDDVKAATRNFPKEDLSIMHPFERYLLDLYVGTQRFLLC